MKKKRFTLDIGCSAAPIPHSDPAGQDAIDGDSVEGAHDELGGSFSLQLAEEVEAPMGLFGQ